VNRGVQVSEVQGSGSGKQDRWPRDAASGSYRLSAIRLRLRARLRARAGAWIDRLL